MSIADQKEESMVPWLFMFAVIGCGFLQLLAMDDGTTREPQLSHRTNGHPHVMSHQQHSHYNPHQVCEVCSESTGRGSDDALTLADGTTPVCDDCMSIDINEEIRNGN